MTHKLFLLTVFSFLILKITAQDTIIVKAFTWNDPSPEGWGANYKGKIHFPDEGEWRKIIMIQHLKCDERTKADTFPCGEWDYITNTVIGVPFSDSIEKYEIGSFVTPYGKRLKMGGEEGWKWEWDVTDYAPILKGEVDISSGNNQELLDLTFFFISGKPPREVISVKNIWPYGIYKYEDLANDSVLKQQHIVLSPKAEYFGLKSRISGHGHFGPHNCCEWDNKTHGYNIGEWDQIRWQVWKDCGFNPIYPQGGTWPFDRAGWCPGTKVDENYFDISKLVTAGDTLHIDYTIENYRENGEKDGEYRISHQVFEYGKANYSLDAEIMDIVSPSTKDEYSRINPICSNPVISVRNSGKTEIKNLFIYYGNPYSKKIYSYKWSGKIEFMETAEISLPEFDYDTKAFFAEIITVNGISDENKVNNRLQVEVPSPVILPEKFYIHIETNDKGRAKENTCLVTNGEGKKVFEFNEYEDDKTYEHKMSLEKGCYTFSFTDKAEDGMIMHWWYWNEDREKVGKNGKISILDFNTKKEIITFPYDFGQEIFLNFVIE